MLRNVAVLALATIAAGFGPAAIIREPDDALDQTMCAEPDAPAETIGPILAEFLRPDLLSCNQVGTAIFDSVYSGCDVLSSFCPCTCGTRSSRSSGGFNCQALACSSGRSFTAEMIFRRFCDSQTSCTTALPASPPAPHNPPSTPPPPSAPPGVGCGLNPEDLDWPEELEELDGSQNEWCWPYKDDKTTCERKYVRRPYHEVDNPFGEWIARCVFVGGSSPRCKSDTKIYEC